MLLLVGLLFDDRLARLIRRFGAGLLAVATVLSVSRRMTCHFPVFRGMRLNP
jgi:hypothetical protein